MRIVCVANQKGGVGKTTTVAGLAGAFAASGRSVLMLDLDPQASLTHWFGLNTSPPRVGTYDLYAASEKPRTLDVAEITYPVTEARVALAPAQAGLATLERSASSRPNLGRTLIQAFSDAKLPYDYVLFDCPPTFGSLMISALAAADLVLIPTQTEPLALQALDGMLRTVSMVERSRKHALPVVIVPSMYDRRTRVAQDSLAALRARSACTVWDEEIPVDTRLREASRNGASPEQFDAASRGANAFARLATWIATNVSAATEENSAEECAA
jgi:chromosome partitioning protein